jgi:hypothetical protein
MKGSTRRVGASLTVLAIKYALRRYEALARSFKITVLSLGKAVNEVNLNMTEY